VGDVRRGPDALWMGLLIAATPTRWPSGAQDVFALDRGNERILRGRRESLKP